MLSQCHSCFNCFCEISNCEAFHLTWEQALLDPLLRNFIGPEDYDKLNRVECNNYNLEYYAAKENLGVDFTDELDEETETQGEGSRASKSDHPDPLTKNQAKSKLPVVPSTDPLELEGCLNVPPGTISSGSFDDNVVITFSTPLLESPIVPNLDFMDQIAIPR